MIEKWEHAQQLGFDAIELRGAGEGRFAARLPELSRQRRPACRCRRSASRCCTSSATSTPTKRRDALSQMKSQLSVMAEIGGRLAMTPASYGMFSTRLPPFDSPRSEADDTEVLARGFGELAAHAEAEGVVIALEPLNRYENHMINTLAQAASLCAEIGSPGLGIAADTYHMNIEEADPIKALVGGGTVDPTRSAQRQQPTRTRSRTSRLVGDAATHLGHRLRGRARVRVPPVRRRRRRAAGLGTADAAAGMDVTAPSPVAERRQLARAAIRVLSSNWHGHATVPSRGLYPHQWSWDSAFIAFGLQHWAPQRAARGAAESVRCSVVRRPGPAHRVQPGRTARTPTFPARRSGGPTSPRAIHRSTPPGSSSRPCMRLPPLR